MGRFTLGNDPLAHWAASMQRNGPRRKTARDSPKLDEKRPEYLRARCTGRDVRDQIVVTHRDHGRASIRETAVALVRFDYKNIHLLPSRAVVPA